MSGVLHLLAPGRSGKFRTGGTLARMDTAAANILGYLSSCPPFWSGARLCGQRGGMAEGFTDAPRCPSSGESWTLVPNHFSMASRAFLEVAVQQARDAK
jgi:hypothetical protein